MKPVYVVLYIILIIDALLFFITLIKERCSLSCNYGTLSTAIITFGLVITAIIGFRKTNEATRLQTSMDFCLSTYHIFQSQDFVEKELYICKELDKRGKNYCAIEDIENDSLRKAIFEYCEIMNGVGVVVLEHMINPETVISYLGANILTTYSLIKPYLDRTRQVRSDNISNLLPETEKKLIKRAKTMTFAHFELLALEIKKQAPTMLNKYEKELYRAKNCKKQ